jgi:hypothetical protein
MVASSGGGASLVAAQRGEKGTPKAILLSGLRGWMDGVPWEWSPHWERFGTFVILDRLMDVVLLVLWPR